jgi:hypothetical protein
MINNRPSIVEHFQKKQKELIQIANNLKQDFVGLDDIIDRMMENIKIWYIFPELQIRPTIVNLWGLTGVGKTDLVRKMISYMKMQDRFLEIEMTGESDTNKTIQKKLEESSLSTDEQVILFLDEFQKFRTVNEDGSQNQNSTAYADVWTLLSDGKFHADLTRRSEVLEQLLASKYNQDWFDSIPTSTSPKKKKKKSDEPIESEPDEKKSAAKERMYHTPFYMARRIKRLFKREESLEDIMKWNEDKIFKLYETFSQDPRLCESEPYKKMLIIVSGNLDEAYRIATDVGEADLDADYYHEMSKRLTIIDIKNALQKRFRPEQIARFGNSHILYPSLSKDNYRKIIIMKCEQINKLIFESKGITITYDKSVYDVIYNNGVFPTQGVRPLLSTVSNILSSALPTFIFECLIKNVDAITIFVNGDRMYCDIAGKEYSATIPTVLDKIRLEIDNDDRSTVAVHELGHALVYALLYNVPPKQICTNSVSPFSNGFVLQHGLTAHKASSLKYIQVSLAGRAAEEIVFGSDFATKGAQHDIQQATAEAWLYVARYGFDGFITCRTQKYDDCLVRDENQIGKVCEQMIQEAKQKATDIINGNIKLFKHLLAILNKNEKMSSAIFRDECRKFGVNLQDAVDGNIVIGYKEKMEKFLETDNPQYVKVIDVTPLPTKSRKKLVAKR